jgi:hypothetical protein
MAAHGGNRSIIKVKAESKDKKILQYSGVEVVQNKM